jgi:4-aminobutyrate aminotransferase-like enzyme
MSDGTEIPALVTEVPGPASRRWIDRLAVRECPAITARRARRASALGAADDDPIVWAEAVGANVTDVDGNRFVDLTAGFGVASVGHRHPDVVAAGAAQLHRLPHVMGDAFPDTQRVKTGRILSGRAGVLSFSGGYHGLSYGSLAVTGYHREAFQAPFVDQLGTHVKVAQFGGKIPDLSDIGTIIVEPIQGRGGIRVPPTGWLAALADAARAASAVLIFDEVYTGFGRTGDWFAFQHEGVRPDVIVLGKGMAAGFPISAAVGTAEAMDAWGASQGEALHTQTFLGNPVGCAMARATLSVLESVIPQVNNTSEWFRSLLEDRGHQVSGRGLMLGIAMDNALAVSRALLHRGFIALPAGEQAEVLSITPPLTITDGQLMSFLDALEAVQA